MNMPKMILILVIVACIIWSHNKVNVLGNKIDGIGKDVEKVNERLDKMNKRIDKIIDKE